MYACSINGLMCSAEDATLSVADHGLLYGDGVFEGLRFYQKQVFRLYQHLVRLQDSAKAINLELPISTDEIVRSIKEVIEASGLSDGYIRLLVTRGEGAMGLDPGNCVNPKAIIIVDELAMVAPKARLHGVNVIIASIRRLSVDQLDPRIKSLNYLNQILAKQEANIAGADEAILLNQSGRIAEGTADNVFVVRDNQLLTPPVSEGALDGVTRSVVMDLARGLGIHCSEALLASYDLFTADECFLTGTGAELIPVASISGRELPPERPVYSRLAGAFRNLVYNPEIESNSVLMTG
ncbi:MAG TPA: branched-chain-amino-acid transaminase [Pseudomonadales bacterium]|jgi:branched-chain amino acid aminotransferase|nr:branched-chain-amino-acid transaminase [Gammaproteobacteria bacterium]MDP6027415.1 branched-chain-amino-acid transaminase [Pseudomonadales bacterium]MDP6315099.1 branched-chain-amino-acid transaminase [Pseudomonadales bacterium]MDP7315889.1 branched-chain-amino-acid transaminase [Pseudomonadales bacterium]MDP7576820.1 branched-chain-amino-acid transaminase [Pseudomonadales bacterium]|tara:strand:+ start:370 stop:1254 length:885 start_codon:yes stop_codon:yes gene_type:complete